MKNKSKLIKMLIIGITVILIIIGSIFGIKAQEENKKNALAYQIRFSDLVSLKDLEKYNNKQVSAIGYLSPIMSYDGGFAYLMNLPYQTCPYCMPSDTKITNTISVFAKQGEKIEFTEAAVIVKGTLKLEPYTDSYGYTYNYRMVDVTIENADTSELGDKITLYNKLAEKEILTGLMDVLYSADNNIYYDEYTANGAVYERTIVDITLIENVIQNLREFEEKEVEQLLNIAIKLKTIVVDTNKFIEEKNYSKLTEYKNPILQLFYSLNDWMGDYQL